jgi:hypothetical protein
LVRALVAFDEYRPPDVSTAILFSPDNVRGVLAGLPSVAALLPDPMVEGESSDAFPDVLRKTHREVYRWIANTHYDHLAEAVIHLERVHAAGCTFGSLLRTRDREQFISLTAEVLVADDLLRRGYTVNTIPLSGEVSPDLHVMADGIDVAIEVYSPRELLAVDAWVKEVSDLLSYVDIRASYSSSVQTRFEQPLPPEPWQHDPWATAEMLALTREGVLRRVTADVEDSLRGLDRLNKAYRHPGTPLLTTVELDDVHQAPAVGPVRSGTISAPGFSGYSPAGVFRTVVERALKKARKRQTQGVPAAARALVVYLMGTKIAEDLSHPAHMNGAKVALDEIDPRDYNLDVIAFVVRSLPQGLAAMLMVWDDTTLTMPEVQAMFGQAP